MTRIAVVVGGTGMAANELAPHLLNDFVGEEAFDKVAVIARGVEASIFDGLSDRPIIALSEANLNDGESIAFSLEKHGVTKVTHTFWFVDANQPPKLGHPVAMRRMLGMASSTQSALKIALRYSPAVLRNKFYGSLSYVAGSGSQPRNLEWLQNYFFALDKVGAKLENFTLGTGGKHYGMHLGPSLFDGYETPFEEDKHKGPGPLSYFEMQDFVERLALEKGFFWNVVRPTFIIGNSLEKVNTTQSFGLVLAVYALILKEQQKPLIFPGGIGNWNLRTQMSTSKKIAQVSAWAATGSACGLGHSTGETFDDPSPSDVQNQAFNVVSCEEFSWSEIWEDIATYFGMETGPAPETSAGCESLTIMEGENTARLLWKELVDQNSLVENDFSQVFNADFFDKSFSATWDSQFSVKKLREKQFPEKLIYEFDRPSNLLLEFFDRLKDANVIPK